MYFQDKVILLKLSENGVFREQEGDREAKVCFQDILRGFILLFSPLLDTVIF
jgi:hypothetical protein